MGIAAPNQNKAVVRPVAAQARNQRLGKLEDSHSASTKKIDVRAKIRNEAIWAGTKSQDLGGNLGEVLISLSAFCGKAPAMIAIKEAETKTIDINLLE